MKTTKMMAIVAVLVFGMVFGLGAAAMADTTIETVHIGNPGNAADYTGYGSVAYEYDFGKCEVLAGQYAAFLNAVAATDTYALYHTSMAKDRGITLAGTGSGIQRTGDFGSYAYTVTPEFVNRPVNYLCWFDMIRFANWMTTGDTETGAYTITGGIPNGGTVTPPDAAQRATWAAGPTKYWMVPTENEWYKAGLYDPNKGGPGVGGYWVYVTGSDTIPAVEGPPGADTPEGSANYNYASYYATVGDPIAFTTSIGGAYIYSASPYGTFDQTGNMWEPFEADDFPLGIRGGCYAGYHDDHLPSSYSQRNTPGMDSEFPEGGFRISAVGGGETVAVIPEPAGLGLFGLALLAIRKRRS